MRTPGDMVWTEHSGWVEAASIVIQANDRGYLYGQGVFETFRSQQGRFFRLREHLQRMAIAAESLGIQLTPLAGVLDALQSGVELYKGQDAVFRLTITAGQGWPSRKHGAFPGITLLARPVTGISVSPLKLSVSRYVRQTGSVHSGKKTLNYLESALAFEQAKQEGCDDAILLDSLGRISETSVGNIFWIRRSTVYTSALFTGALPGILREEVLKLCASLGIRTCQGGYSLEHLLRSDAVFVTNSAARAKPVSQVDSLVLPSAVSNEIFASIKINLAEVVEKESRTVKDIATELGELL